MKRKWNKIFQIWFNSVLIITPEHNLAIQAKVINILIQEMVFHFYNVLRMKGSQMSIFLLRMGITFMKDHESELSQRLADGTYSSVEYSMNLYSSL